MNAPIAIVGLGCRFAGAADAHAFWDLMVEGRNSFGPVPEDRWNHEQFFDANPRATDKSYAPNGAFIDDVRSFPALTLGIPPRRVEVMDPQQRLSIEVALAAIQDAGYQPSELPRRTGVYMGVSCTEWRTLLSSRVVAQLMASGTFGAAPEDLEALAATVENVVPSRPFTAPGALSNMIAAAVAQELDLHGPAMVTDAACASSLVALHAAAAGLRAGTLDAAVVGGVYLALTPENHIGFSRIGAISKSGVCRPFDADADGFVQGDGAGSILIKRLDDAIRDGDRVYAVLDGIAANNDGRGDGPMAPVLAGQVEAIQAAWSDAQRSPRTVGYVETHGTGTQVGDLTEFMGLIQALDGAERAALGSSKGNVGHTMSAAGMAGLLRTILAIHHRTVPPMANFQAAKDDLGLTGSAFYIPTEATRWEGERVAGVSSFGFGGTNVHVVLSAPPEPQRTPHVQAELLLFSAPDSVGLPDAARQILGSLQKGASLAAVARALAVRTRLPARAALAAGTAEQAIAGLQAFLAGEEHDLRVGTAIHDPKVGYLFPGQGAQRTGMLDDARRRFPLIQRTLDEVDRYVELDIPITQLLYPETRAVPVDESVAEDQLTDTGRCQPALFACSLALSRLLREVGVVPIAATGHSLGEFNAAVEAGVLSATDGARFVAARAAAMAAVSGDVGAMAAVMADRPTVESLLVEGVVIANINHPRQLVVSGTTEGVQKVIANATAANLSAKPLTVSHGFHSPVFDGLDANDWLRGITLSDPQLTVASGIIDHPYTGAEEARRVFERHTRSPVDFVGALRQMVDAGANLLLQVGAGGPLASFARGSVGADVQGIQTLGGRKDHDGGLGLLEGLGWLWCQGVDIDVRPITAPAHPASLQAERLPREDYWPLKAKRTKRVRLDRVAAANLPVELTEEVAIPIAMPGAADPDRDKVFAVVAKVSAYPIDALKASMRLVDDLGFDSLMVGDMASGLAAAFPGLGGIPQELLINGPTVQDLVDFVKTAGEAAEADDDAPLIAYAPVWREATLAGRSDRDTRRNVALLVGDGLDIVASGLVACGVDCTTDADQAADLVVWSKGGDSSAALIATLANQVQRGANPDVLALLDGDDHAAASTAGVVRAFAAERSVLGKVLVDVPASAVTDEWLDNDLTADVRYFAGERHVAGFAPAAEVPTRQLDSDSVVLVSGGTRGIGFKLAERLAARGCTVLLLARTATPIQGFTTLAADVTDLPSLKRALGDRTINAVIHAAGVLADGPVESVTAEAGALARSVKIDGMKNLVAACPVADVFLGIGSWAGRFGNRHQVHYASANAGMAGLCATDERIVVSEFGPWTESDMVRTIPAAIQATMRSEGVDFVGDEAGINALLHDFDHGVGIRTQGRDLPYSTRSTRTRIRLSTETHPYLLDHAILGTPVLPLAAAADMLVRATGVCAPFVLDDLRLYQGITVKEPVQIEVIARGHKVEIRAGARRALAYRAEVRPVEPIEIPAPSTGGDPPTLSLEAFYDGKTFHGPLLQGITAIEAVGRNFVRGRIRSGRPADWVPGTSRTSFSVDPLALDSAMQLSGYVALTRFQRAGTPVGIGRLVQLAPLPEGEMLAEVHFGDREDDRFVGTIVIRDLDGTPLLVAIDTVAELRKLAPDDLGDFEIKPQWVDFGTWPALKDLDDRLAMAAIGGIRNPYFSVHDGTARDTTSVQGVSLVNFSSYNYLGLSGDDRVVSDVQAAVARYGTSVSASRVASGERPFHGELEKLLAQCQDTEDALVFTAGHATNVTAIGHLMGPKDLVIHDEFIHDSAIQGIKLAGCARRGFKHDDPHDLELQLKELRKHYEKVLIVVEGVYSMDGDICDMPAYIALKKKYGCLLMCDEAHSFGVVGATGQGVREHFGFAGSEVDIWMGTLSKSVASCGGWIAGSKPLIRYLRYTAPGFVYSAGITAANGVAALRSLQLMLDEPERVQKLQANAQFFHDELVRQGIDTGPAKGGSGVIPTITGNSLHALFLSQRLQEQGINVQPIVYPAVADDSARLRFFLSSTHSFEQLRDTANKVATLLAAIRVEFPIL